MQVNVKKTMLGALIAAALAAAGYYAIVNREISDKIKSKAHEFLTEEHKEIIPKPQRPTPPHQQPIPAPPSPAPGSSQ